VATILLVTGLTLTLQALFAPTSLYTQVLFNRLMAEFFSVEVTVSLWIP